MAQFQSLGQLVKTSFLTDKVPSWPWLRWFGLVADRLTSPVESDIPATASSTGTRGEIRADANFVYICTAKDTWKRAALSTF